MSSSVLQFRLGLGDLLGKQAVQKLPEKKKLERFMRIVELPLVAGDVNRGYQIELVWVDGDRIARRKLVGKPNLFEYAFTSAGDMIDPRNASIPEDAEDE